MSAQRIHTEPYGGWPRNIAYLIERAKDEGVARFELKTSEFEVLVIFRDPS